MNRIVVTGGRNYDDWAMVQEVLNRFAPKEVYVGDCPTGVDKMVAEWCDHRKVNYKIFVANWNKLGKKAGPMRNAEMCRSAGSEATVIAFPGNKGTNDCVRTAVSYNMIVMRVEP